MVGVHVMHAQNLEERREWADEVQQSSIEQGDGAVRELLCCVLEEVEVEEGQRRKRKEHTAPTLASHFLS